jgi:hypothetical protein
MYISLAAKSCAEFGNDVKGGSNWSKNFCSSAALVFV